MNRQKVVIAENLEQSLQEAIIQCEHDRMFLLADKTTEYYCLPVVEGFAALKDAKYRLSTFRMTIAPPMYLRSTSRLPQDYLKFAPVS